MENNLTFEDNQRLARRGRKTFGSTESAMATFLFIVFNLAFSLILRNMNLKYAVGDLTYFTLSFIVESLFALVAVVVSLTRRVDLVSAAGLNKRINGKIIGYCFLVSLVALILFSDLTSVFVELLYMLGYESILPDMAITNIWQYIGYTITACFVAAFAEELLFRGTILSGLKKFGSKIAIIVSALIFMLMHGNAEQTVHQFIIGLLIGYLFYMTGNLWIGFIIHFFNNFISITESFILQIILSQYKNPEAAEGAAEAGTTLTGASAIISFVMNVIFAIGFAWLGYIIMKRLFKKILAENTKLNNKEAVAEINNASSEIVVDGKVTTVEVTLDNKPVETENKQKEKLSVAAIILFVLSGLYLVTNWILALCVGF